MVNVFLFFILVYGPYILIPLGLLLAVRLFFMKNRARKSVWIAISTLSIGIILAAVALFLHANGNI